MRKLRMALTVFYISVGFLISITTASGLLAQTHDYTSSDLLIEHRFTSIETQLITMATEVHELKQRGEWDWLKSLAMVVLVGDAATRQIKKKASLIITGGGD